MSKYQDRDTVQRILKNSKTIAVVGLSDKKERPSYGVAAYLQNQGYKIIPVNPRVSEVLGEKSYPDLKSIPQEIDVVDVFRKSEAVLPIAENAISKGARAIWLQEGVVNQEAARLAGEAGIDFVMDLCMKKMHEEYGS